MANWTGLDYVSNTWAIFLGQLSGDLRTRARALIQDSFYGHWGH
jgi:hypothetical protein